MSDSVVSRAPDLNYVLVLREQLARWLMRVYPPSGFRAGTDTDERLVIDMHELALDYAHT